MIDFGRVKKVTLGAGEVVKIQDKNGVVLWEKPYLSISPTSESVGYGSGSFTINITTTQSWTLTCSDSRLSFSKKSGSGNAAITVSYPAASSGISATITVTASGGETATCSFHESAEPEPAYSDDFENHLNDSSLQMEIGLTDSYGVAPKSYSTLSRGSRTSFRQWTNRYIAIRLKSGSESGVEIFEAGESPAVSGIYLSTS